MHDKWAEGRADEGKCWFKTQVFFQSDETPPGRLKMRNPAEYTQGHSVDGIVPLKIFSAHNASRNDYSRPQLRTYKTTIQKSQTEVRFSNNTLVKWIFYFCCMIAFPACICTCILCIPSDPGGHKMVLDLLVLESWMTESEHVLTKNTSQILFKSNKY